jgi:nucleoid DNA-binding protein
MSRVSKTTYPIILNPKGLTMLMKQFIEEIQANGNYPSKKAARAALDTVTTTIKQILSKGDTIHISEFGRFSAPEITKLFGVTGEQITSKVVRFYPSQLMKKTVNNKA